MTPPSTSLVWNGTEFVSCIGIPITDRGFRYGMALFESLAIRGGCVEFLDAHLSRLEAACRCCGWPLDPTLLMRAGERLGQFTDPTFARIYVTAGEGAPTSPITSPGLYLFAEPRSNPAVHPLRITMHSEPFAPLLGGLKTANYWANILAMQKAHAAGANEALVFNPHDQLLSGCMANVFLVLDDSLVTPPVSNGARAGVVREWVMQRRTVMERSISRADINQASACFLTSSWAGIAPVSALDDKPLDTSIGDALRTEFFGK